MKKKKNNKKNLKLKFDSRGIFQSKLKTNV
jgi:hypothetical protein